MGRRKRQLVFFMPKDAADPSAGSTPLGTPRELTDALRPYNTAPDRDDARSTSGTSFFHGPGLVVEIATGQDEINQALVTVLDEDFALPVLMRLCRGLGWKMQDAESGQIFG